MTTKPILIVKRGEICYKSQEDDQSYGMWCPVTPDTEHGLRNGTQLYAAPPDQQPHDHVAVTWDAARTRILAVTLQDAEGRVLCVIDEAPAQQPQYEAGDMASAHNDGFRAGVASVAQQPQAEAVRWCPDVCPITGKPFFMWIGHPKHGDVPTYGGPYDSYTIPVRHEDGSFCCERYDHDNGWWVTDEVHDVGVQIVSDQAYVSDEAPQQAEAVPSDVVRDAEGQ